MPMGKLLSICILSYNRKEKLKRLLDSIISESKGLEDEVEVCVSDNCSTDGTQQYIEDMRKGFPLHFVAKLSDKNYGVDRNILNALSLSRGKFAWFMGDDDFLVKGTLGKLLSFLRSIDDDNIAVIYLGETDNGNTSNYDLITRPNAFLSNIIVRVAAASSVGKNALEQADGTGYAHSWIIRMIGFENPKNVAVYFKKNVVSGDQSNRRIVLLEQLKFSRASIRQYSWLLFNRGVCNKYSFVFIKKFLGALFFPYFHLLCEKVFRPKNVEKIPAGTFFNLFGLCGIPIWLYSIVLRVTPHALADLKLRVALWFLNLLRLTPEPRYEFWKIYWEQNSEREELSPRSYF